MSETSGTVWNVHPQNTVLEVQFALESEDSQLPRVLSWNTSARAWVLDGIGANLACIVKPTWMVGSQMQGSVKFASQVSPTSVSAVPSPFLDPAHHACIDHQVQSHSPWLSVGTSGCTGLTCYFKTNRHAKAVYLTLYRVNLAWPWHHRASNPPIWRLRGQQATTQALASMRPSKTCLFPRKMQYLQTRTVGPSGV